VSFTLFSSLFSERNPQYRQLLTHTLLQYKGAKVTILLSYTFRLIFAATSCISCQTSGTQSRLLNWFLAAYSGRYGRGRICGLCSLNTQYHPRLCSPLPVGHASLLMLPRRWTDDYWFDATVTRSTHWLRHQGKSKTLYRQRELYIGVVNNVRESVSLVPLWQSKD